MPALDLFWRFLVYLFWINVIILAGNLAIFLFTGP
jgi:hypothetical protein